MKKSTRIPPPPLASSSSSSRCSATSSFPNSSSSPSSSVVRLCEMCRRVEGIYSCPKCRARTCSLECCQWHKRQRNCNGRRDRTQHVLLGKYNDSTLKSDYHFLEDVLRITAQAKHCRRCIERPSLSRGGAKPAASSGLTLVTRHDKNNAATSSTTESQRHVEERGSDEKRQKVEEADRRRLPLQGGAAPTDAAIESLLSRNTKSPNNNTPPHLKRLEGMAKERGVTLLFMPSGMERRLENTTTIVSPANNLRNRKRKMTKSEGDRDAGDAADGATQTPAAAIHWKVEWKIHCKPLVEPDNGSSTDVAQLTSNRVPEDVTLWDAFLHALKRRQNGSIPETTLLDFVEKLAAVALKETPQEATIGLRFYLQKWPCPQNRPCFIELSPSVTFRNALRGQTLIEHPTLQVTWEGPDSKATKTVTTLKD